VDMYIVKLSQNILHSYIHKSQNYKLNIQLAVVARNMVVVMWGGWYFVQFRVLKPVYLCVDDCHIRQHSPLHAATCIGCLHIVS
jgi:hypothetical protein